MQREDTRCGAKSIKQSICICLSGLSSRATSKSLAGARNPHAMRPPASLSIGPWAPYIYQMRPANSRCEAHNMTLWRLKTGKCGVMKTSGHSRYCKEHRQHVKLINNVDFNAFIMGRSQCITVVDFSSFSFHANKRSHGEQRVNITQLLLILIYRWSLLFSIENV